MFGLNIIFKYYNFFYNVIKEFLSYNEIVKLNIIIKDSIGFYC